MDDGLLPAWREKLQKNKGNSNYIYDILAHSPSSSFCISVGHFVSMPLILVYPFPHPPSFPLSLRFTPLPYQKYMTLAFRNIIYDRNER